MSTEVWLDSIMLKGGRGNQFSLNRVDGSKVDIWHGFASDDVVAAPQIAF